LFCTCVCTLIVFAPLIWRQHWWISGPVIWQLIIGLRLPVQQHAWNLEMAWSCPHIWLC
jgi:hypothetical protein